MVPARGPPSSRGVVINRDTSGPELAHPRRRAALTTTIASVLRRSEVAIVGRRPDAAAQWCVAAAELDELDSVTGPVPAVSPW